MDEIKKAKLKRVSFPYISIRDAIHCIEKLKASEGFTEVHYTVALQKMGYTPTSSSADRVLSALVNSYGLLDQKGTKNAKFVSISRLAKEILLNAEGSDERKRAVMQAVENDELMKKILQKWNSGIPSRENIIKTLQLDPEFEFTEPAAIRFATVIQQTYEVIDLSEYSEYNGTDVQEDFETTGDEMLTQTLEKSEKTQRSVSEYSLALTGKERAVLRVPNHLKEKDFDRIIQWLNLMKDALLDENQETNE